MRSLARRSRLGLCTALSLWLFACTHDWDRGAPKDAATDEGDATPTDAAQSPSDGAMPGQPDAGGADGSVSPGPDANLTNDGATPTDASIRADGAATDAALADAGPADAATQDAQSNQPDAAVDSGPPTCPQNHGCPDVFPCVANPGGYTCRGQRADWPVPLRKPGDSAAVQQFTVSSATLLDQVTGLMWERVQSDQPRTHDAAYKYCEALSLEGHDDFRMPSHIEMATWLATDAVPKLDGAILGTYQDGRHWTVNPDRKMPAYRWVVLLANGVIWSQETTDAELHMVRCVRTHAQKYSGTNATRASVNAAGVLLDRATGLSWEQSVQGVYSAITFAAATTHCDELSFDGKSDWRLPTLVELLTTVDLSQTGASAIASPFLGPIGDRDCYWSSSLFSGTNGMGEERFLISPGGDNFSYPITKTDALCAARCVRK